MATIKFEDLTKDYFVTLDRGQLISLQSIIGEVLTEGAEAAKAKAKADALALFAAAGISLEEAFPELMWQGAGDAPKRGRKSRGDAAVKPSTDAAKARFRHPLEASLTWSGGRGRVPLWVADVKSKGINMADIELDENGNWLDEASAQVAHDLLKASS